MIWLWVVGCEPVEEAPVDTGEVPSCVSETTCEGEVCWTSLCGRSFFMGAPEGEGEEDEGPQRSVQMPDFEITQTEVTVETWDRCVAEAACEPITDPTVLCTDRGPDDPRGCLDWWRAEALCTWLGGRLASEAEWEFAARGGGREVMFPWGDHPPSCGLAVLGYTGDSCVPAGPAPVCSRAAGHTPQGLCDLAGNLYEWVEDDYHETYEDGPLDGTAWVDGDTPFRVLRGGGIHSDESITTTNRTFHPPEFTYSGSGARCVR